MNDYITAVSRNLKALLASQTSDEMFYLGLATVHQTTDHYTQPPLPPMDVIYSRVL